MYSMFSSKTPNLSANFSSSLSSVFPSVSSALSDSLTSLFDCTFFLLLTLCESASVIPHRFFNPAHLMQDVLLPPLQNGLVFTTNLKLTDSRFPLALFPCLTTSPAVIRFALRRPPLLRWPRLRRHRRISPLSQLHLDLLKDLPTLLFTDVRDFRHFLLFVEVVVVVVQVSVSGNSAFPSSYSTNHVPTLRPQGSALRGKYCHISYFDSIPKSNSDSPPT